ncbi:hypothetical protein HanIR_Chr04g0206681 [Helianthus annuus]|nr:hypothetical protein HanIR_Chr04g0206681 [Helianthus annuus]
MSQFFRIIKLTMDPPSISWAIDIQVPIIFLTSFLNSNICITSITIESLKAMNPDNVL